MLILRRRVGEAIAIGNGIEIEILEINAYKVKIGIHAPADVSVQRREMLRVGQQNVQAASLTAKARSALGKELADLFSRIPSGDADMNCEARYSGHPEKENLEPA